jgi:catechol 2,3-dioxygenase-like lactoylglutathione lyase family enzyme
MAEGSLLADEIVLTHFIVSDDIDRSCRFYTEILGSRTIDRAYSAWSALGAEFVTPPKHQKTEIRCYIRMVT